MPDRRTVRPVAVQLRMCRPHLFAYLSTLCAVNIILASALYTSKWNSVWRVVLCVGCCHTVVVSAILAVGVKTRKWVELIGKRPDGSIPIWSFVVWYPFYAGCYLFMSIARQRDTHLHTLHEIRPGWFVGGWLATTNRPTGAATSFAGVLDLTCELPRRAPVHRDTAYRVIPTWDGTPPTVEMIESGVRFLVERSRFGPVVCHCAYGRGRSVTLLIGGLIRSGYFERWEVAFEAVKSIRPTAKLNPAMRRALSQWQAAYPK